MIRELVSPAQVRAACGDDDLVMWVAQGLARGGRAWALGDAVVATCAGLARWDRLAISGGTACVADLVRHALGELGPSLRLLGDRELVAGAAAKVEGVEVKAEFSWMSLPAVLPSSGPVGEPVWLGPEAEDEVAALLAEFAPESYAVPGMAGVSRWAGIRVTGRLAAVAANAWSAPAVGSSAGVGFLAGVATAGPFRGRGLGERLCRWVSAELVKGYGRAALVVDDVNASALGVYGRIGYERRRVAAAGLKEPG